MNLWRIFQLVMQLAPVIIGLVRQVETAMPGPKLGTEKLNLVLDIVQVAADTEPEISAAITNKDLATAVTSIVNATVRTLNTVGAFKTTP